MHIKDKVILLTGGTSGIGAGCSRRYAELGARVVFASVQEAEGQALEAELKGQGYVADFVYCDVTCEDSVKALVQKALDLHGRIDCCHSNAGVWRQGKVTDFTEDDFNFVMGVNVKGNFLPLREFRDLADLNAQAKAGKIDPMIGRSSELERLVRSRAGANWQASADFAETIGHLRTAVQIPSAAHCALEYQRWAVRSQLRTEGRRFMKALDLRTLTIPLLHLRGEDDPYVLADPVDKTRRYAPHGQYVSVPGAGHFAHEEAPEVVNDHLMRFLG